MWFASIQCVISHVMQLIVLVGGSSADVVKVGSASPASKLLNPLGLDTFSGCRSCRSNTEAVCVV